MGEKDFGRSTEIIHWKEELAILEQEGSFDIAIFLLEKVIKENPNEMDAYIFLLYRLMDTLVEGSCYWLNVSNDSLRDIKREYYDAKDSDYIILAKKYFAESYKKFCNNPEYLYYVGHGMGPANYFFGVDDDMQTAMLNKAKKLGYNAVIEEGRPRIMAASFPGAIAWATRIMHNPSLKDQLATKGAAAEYILGKHLYWAKKILEEAEK